MEEHYICTDKEFFNKINFAIEKEHIYHICYEPYVYWIYEKGERKYYVNIDNSYTSKIESIYRNIKKYMDKNKDFKYIYEVNENKELKYTFNVLKRITDKEFFETLKKEEEIEKKDYEKYVEYENKIRS